MFSAQSNAESTQMVIENALEKSKSVLGAPVGRRFALFVDDVNMPSVEEYGAQPPIELLRQLLDFEGVYDHEKRLVMDKFSGCINDLCRRSPGGGRNELPMRFVRHFNVICMANASKETMQKNFGLILNGHMLHGGFKNEIHVLTDFVVTASIDIYNEICEAMRPTPTRAHYLFNLRDVSKVFQGVLQISKLMQQG